MFLGWISILPRKNAKMSRFVFSGAGHCSSISGLMYGGIKTCSARWQGCGELTPKVCRMIDSCMKSGIPSAIAASSCAHFEFLHFPVKKIRNLMVFTAKVSILNSRGRSEESPRRGSRRRSHGRRRRCGRGRGSGSRRGIRSRGSGRRSREGAERDGVKGGRWGC